MWDSSRTLLVPPIYRNYHGDSGILPYNEVQNMVRIPHLQESHPKGFICKSTEKLVNLEVY